MKAKLLTVQTEQASVSPAEIPVGRIAQTGTIDLYPLIARVTTSVILRVSETGVANFTSCAMNLDSPEPRHYVLLPVGTKIELEF